MVERSKPEPKYSDAKLTQWRAQLAIDRHDLDECVIRQPELFDHTAEAHAMALAERDAIKLELDEAEAAHAERLRVTINPAKKPTETSIKDKVALVPEVQELQRELLTAKRLVEAWSALKESYKQRSYMLTILCGDTPRNVRERVAEEARARIQQERVRSRNG